MTLREKQSIFAFLTARLMLFMNENGYEFTYGEAKRSDEEALRLSKLGIGSKNSLHRKSLAIDLNLFKNGKYLDKTEDHRMFGEWWERQHTNCRWGGHFKTSNGNTDGNHYEFTENPWR